MNAASTSRPRRAVSVGVAAVLATVLGLGVSPAAVGAGNARPVLPAGSAAAAVPHRDGLDDEALQAALEVFTAEYGVAAVAEVVGPTGRWQGATGVRALEADQATTSPPAARPARPQDRFRVASLTKPMVATLALQEVARGRWTLETTVGDVLPGLLPGHDRVTLAQLLSHRTGLPDYLAPLIAGATSPQQAVDLVSVPQTDAALVSVALAQPWRFEPGTSFDYSNTNYVVVGMMLTAALHHPVGGLLERRIFEPAGMRDSSYPSGPRIAGAHLTEYAVFDRPYSLATFEPSVFSSAGAVVSTTGDLNRFWRALSTGRLLPAHLVEVMRTPLTQRTLPYGLGTFVAPDPCASPGDPDPFVYGHDGQTFGTSTLSMSSADGSRRFTVATTGRSFSPGAAPVPFSQFFATAFAATCPTPAQARRAVDTRVFDSDLPAQQHVWALP